MNTKKQIALPIVVVIAVLLAFSSPAVADYSGDKPLVTYDHDVIYGGVVYETVEDNSTYTTLNATETCPECGMDSLTQTIEIIGIPAGATVKMARLYNYYTWSTSDNDMGGNPWYNLGMPAEADIWFNGEKRVCQHGLGDGLTNRTSLANPIEYGNGVKQYWDTKGQGYSSKYCDYPSGTFAWDVTDMVTGNGIYTATIENADSTPTGFRPGEVYPSYKRERFATYGFGLLVIYEHPDIEPKIEYWINEGRDLLWTYYGKHTPEEATTYAPFNGVVNWGMGTVYKDATLTAVLTASDKGTNVPPANMVTFNGDEKGPSTAKDANSIAKDLFNVSPELVHKNNFADFQDRGDYEGVCNAFLVVEKISPSQ